jgi:hypothetical protein
MSSASTNLSRIDQLVKRLASRSRMTNFGSTLTLLIGLIAVGALSFYFYYGYTEIKNITNPKTVVDFIQGQISDNAVPVREAAAKHIRESAPKLAEDLSNQLMAQMPVARGELESHLRTFIQGKFDEAKVLTQDTFRKLIQDHRAEFDEAMKTIQSDKESEKFMDMFMPIVEKNAGFEIQTNAGEALGAFGDLNNRLEKLAKGENLTDLEKQQRYLLGLVQRLRVEQTDLK